MRYYCPKCKTEYTDGGKYFVQEVCGSISGDGQLCRTQLKELPDFETPSQYEKRTGREWNGAVWIRYRYIGDRITSSTDWCDWYPKTAEDANKPSLPTWQKREVQSLCANSPEPPPDEYVPEVEA